MNKLSLVVPNGSLEKQVLAMLAMVGLQVNRPTRQFSVRASHPLIHEVVFMRPHHIPRLVSESKYDMGICGLDMEREYSYPCTVGGMGKPQCVGMGSFLGPKADIKPTQIVLFAHKDDPARQVEDVEVNEPVISEYPTITEKWFINKRPMDPHDLDGPTEIFAAHAATMCGNILRSYGSTEAHVPRDYRFGVCLTESGATLAANSLKIIGTLMRTYPVLIGRPGIKSQALALDFWQQLFEVGLLKGGKSL